MLCGWRKILEYSGAGVGRRGGQLGADGVVPAEPVLAAPAANVTVTEQREAVTRPRRLSAAPVAARRRRGLGSERIATIDRPRPDHNPNYAPIVIRLNHLPDSHPDPPSRGAGRATLGP